LNGKDKKEVGSRRYVSTIKIIAPGSGNHIFENSIRLTLLLIKINNMENTTIESFTIYGENLLNKVKELIAEGNVRKISIHEKSGKELMSFPLTFGVVGVVFAPVLAAIGALAALVGECTITVEREHVEP
jgi:hypothetical protein